MLCANQRFSLSDQDALVSLQSVSFSIFSEGSIGSRIHMPAHMCDSHFHTYRFGRLIIDEKSDMSLSSFFPDQLAAGASPVRVVTLMT